MDWASNAYPGPAANNSLEDDGSKRIDPASRKAPLFRGFHFVNPPQHRKSNGREEGSITFSVELLSIRAKVIFGRRLRWVQSDSVPRKDIEASRGVSGRRTTWKIEKVGDRICFLAASKPVDAA